MADSFNLTARGFLTNSDGKILLCQNIKRGYYTLAGGHVDLGESAASAVVREFFEEFGLDCQVKNFICIFEQEFEKVSPEGQKRIVKDYTLLFELWPKDGNLNFFPIQKESHIKPVFIAPEQLEIIDFHPRLLIPILKEWLKNRINSDQWTAHYNSALIFK